MHAARSGHSTQIIARQIHKHYMLGILFRVCQQFFFQCQILYLIPTTRTRTGYRP